MNGRSWLPLGFFLILLVLAAGCTSLSVGNVSYGAGNLSVTIAGAGTPAGTGVQVRVYKLDEFEQHELLTTGTTATLSGTETTVAIPMHLDPGRYKIFVYLTTGGQREAAVIRDIAV
jgi:hypothetical protein